MKNVSNKKNGGKPQQKRGLKNMGVKTNEKP